MKYLSIACALILAGLSAGQDMPLHEILKPGEGWKAHSGEMPAMKPGGYRVDAKNRMIVLDRVMDNPGEPLKYTLKEPTACVVALGGAQLLVADATDRYIWAFRIEKDGSLGTGDRYCRLRVTGDERRKKVTDEQKYKADPSAMTIDGAGRTYVATNLGIQSFDPTGRLNGVFTAPPGRVTELTFDGNKLYARADGKVYVRIMLAEGAKK
jgi:sugar lactone lactonase YvrE